MIHKIKMGHNPLIRDLLCFCSTVLYRGKMQCGKVYSWFCCFKYPQFFYMFTYIIMFNFFNQPWMLIFEWHFISCVMLQIENIRNENHKTNELFSLSFQNFWFYLDLQTWHRLPELSGLRQCITLIVITLSVQNSSI